MRPLSFTNSSRLRIFPIAILSLVTFLILFHGCAYTAATKENREIHFTFEIREIHDPTPPKEKSGIISPAARSEHIALLKSLPNFFEAKMNEKKREMLDAGSAQNGIGIIVSKHEVKKDGALIMFVESVQLDSPAEKAGLKAQDIVREINGTKLAWTKDTYGAAQIKELNQLFGFDYDTGTFKPDYKLELTLLRGKTKLAVSYATAITRHEKSADAKRLATEFDQALAPLLETLKNAVNTLLKKTFPIMTTWEEYYSAQNAAMSPIAQKLMEFQEIQNDVIARFRNRKETANTENIKHHH